MSNLSRAFIYKTREFPYRTEGESNSSQQFQFRLEPVTSNWNLRIIKAQNAAKIEQNLIPV